jgi:hypothetical protein
MRTACMVSLPCKVSKSLQDHVLRHVMEAPAEAVASPFLDGTYASNVSTHCRTYLRTGRGAVTPRSRSSNGIVYSAMVRDLSDLRDDDEAAAAEQAAQVGSEV